MTGSRSIKAHFALRIQETSNFPKDTVTSRRGRSLRVRKQGELMTRREKRKKHWHNMTGGTSAKWLILFYESMKQVIFPSFPKDTMRSRDWRSSRVNKQWELISRKRRRKRKQKHRQNMTASRSAKRLVLFYESMKQAIFPNFPKDTVGQDTDGHQESTNNGN